MSLCVCEEMQVSMNIKKARALFPFHPNSLCEVIATGSRYINGCQSNDQICGTLEPTVLVFG